MFAKAIGLSGQILSMDNIQSCVPTVSNLANEGEEATGDR